VAEPSGRSPRPLSGVFRPLPYWTSAATATVGRANLDGTGVDQSFITGARTPFGVAVDGAHVYWANRGGLSGTGAALDDRARQPRRHER
jgi:virginiamycin B lyase